MNYHQLKAIIALLFFAFILNLETFSQNQKAGNNKDSLPDPIFKRVLNQQFTNLITGQSKTSIGNFAAIDLKDAEVSFAGSSILKSKEKSKSKHNSVLTIKASGGISDGVFAIFENSKLNTNVALDLQYNFLRPTGNSLTYYDTSAQQILKKIEQVKEEYELKMIAIREDQPKRLLKMELQRMGELKKALDTLKMREGPGMKRDSLDYEITKLAYLIKKQQEKVDSFPGPSELTYELTLWRNLQLKNLKQSGELTIYGFKLGWFSVGYKVHNNSFKVFNSVAAFSQQVSDTDFVTHEARIQYSYYRWTRELFKTFFFDVGAAFSYEDNFSSLEKVELSETSEYGPVSGARTSVSKYNVYKGIYERNLKGLRLYGDYYRFLFTDNVAALHANLEFKARDTEKPKWNALLGFFVSFKNAKEENAVVNAELYYNFVDLFRTVDTELKFFERNNFGIRFSFPITFKN